MAYLRHRTALVGYDDDVELDEAVSLALVVRRHFRVRVRSTIRGTVSKVTIFINGKRVKTVTGQRLNLPIDLRGLPKGRVRVRLRVELTDGRARTDTRVYRTCATTKRRGRFG